MYTKSTNNKSAGFPNNLNTKKFYKELKGYKKVKVVK